MNANQLFADINTNCLTEVVSAACSYYDVVRALTARQSYFIYPNGDIACLTSVDGGNTVTILDDDDAATFNHIYMA